MLGSGPEMLGPHPAGGMVRGAESGPESPGRLANAGRPGPKTRMLAALNAGVHTN